MSPIQNGQVEDGAQNELIEAMMSDLSSTRRTTLATMEQNDHGRPARAPSVQLHRAGPLSYDRAGVAAWNSFLGSQGVASGLAPGGVSSEIPTGQAWRINRALAGGQMSRLPPPRPVRGGRPTPGGQRPVTAQPARRVVSTPFRPATAAQARPLPRQQPHPPVAQAPLTVILATRPDAPAPARVPNGGPNPVPSVAAATLPLRLRYMLANVVSLAGFDDSPLADRDANPVQANTSTGVVPSHATKPVSSTSPKRNLGSPRTPSARASPEKLIPDFVEPPYDFTKELFGDEILAFLGEPVTEPDPELHSTSVLAFEEPLIDLASEPGKISSEGPEAELVSEAITEIKIEEGEAEQPRTENKALNRRLDDMMAFLATI